MQKTKKSIQTFHGLENGCNPRYSLHFRLSIYTGLESKVQGTI
jgi:hypothetical protein